MILIREILTRSKPGILRCLAVVVLALGLPLAAPATTAAAGMSALPPNIVLIQIDDLGWSDVGCYGNDFIDTPAIDRLAQEGMRFTQAYGGGPICTPSRAALITGLHCARLHITGQPGYKQDDTSKRKFAHPDFTTALPADAPTIAKTLKLAGYASYCVGKWGLTSPPEQSGFHHADAADDDELTRRAVAVIEQNANRPFFLYFNPHLVHVPLHPKPALLAKYKAKARNQPHGSSPGYAAEVEDVDHQVATIVATLARLKLADRTVLIFTSDNGGFLGTQTEPVTTNKPLREGKASLYEGGIRVPLIVRWPGVTGPGMTCNFPVHWIDWHATLADIAGLNPKALPRLDGRSFAPLLRGASTLPVVPLFWHYPHYRRAMAGISASPSSAVRDGDWKLLHFYEDDHVELYNLHEDSGETRDLAAKFPEIAAALRHELDAWRTAVGAQAPVPNPRRP